jgi:hypothetical protein
MHCQEWKNGARRVWSWWTTSSSPVHCPASSEISGTRPHAGGKYQKGDWKDDDIIMSSLHGLRPTYPSEREVWKHRLNIELDLQSLFGLRVTWCAQLYSLAETLHTPHPPVLGPSYTRTFLVTKDRREKRRHLFVTPCLESKLAKLHSFTISRRLSREKSKAVDFFYM